MSYQRDIDEIPTLELERELKQRAKALALGVCDYCGRPGDTNVCRFPERHAIAQRGLREKEEAWKRSIENTPREM